MNRRALILAHETSRSGAPRQLWSLLEGIAHMAPQAWALDVWARAAGLDWPAWHERFRARQLADPRGEGRTWQARLWRRLYDRPLAQPRRLRAWVGQVPPGYFGLVHNNTATNGDLLATLHQLGAPIVTHVHETSFSLRRFVRPRDWAQTVRVTRRFIAVSPAVAADLVRDWQVPPARVTVVPNFLPELPPLPDHSAAAQSVRERLGLPAQVRLVVTLGHLDRVKGPEAFVALLAALRDESQPIHGIWAGRAESHQRRQLMRRARDHGVADRLHAPGAVIDPACWLAAADVVAVTSQEESFSLAALEAAAIARPVVAFAGARGPVEVLGAEPDLLAPGHETDELAHRVRQLLRDSAAAAAAGERLRRRVAAEFLAARRVPEILRLWEEVTRERA